MLVDCGRVLVTVCQPWWWWALVSGSGHGHHWLMVLVGAVRHLLVVLVGTGHCLLVVLVHAHGVLIAVPGYWWWVAMVRWWPLSLRVVVTVAV